MRSNSIPFDRLFWHDGVFKSLSIVAPPSRRAMGEVALDVSLFPLQPDALYPPSSGRPQRASFRLTFSGVSSIGISCDMADLFEAHGVGNIDVVWLREVRRGHRFIMALFGGELAINYRKVRVERS